MPQAEEFECRTDSFRSSRRSTCSTTFRPVCAGT